MSPGCQSIDTATGPFTTPTNPESLIGVDERIVNEPGSSGPVTVGLHP